MNVQAKTVAGAVEKALHSSLHRTCFKAFGFEVIQDFVMNIVGIGAMPDAPECDLLSFLDAVVGVS